MSGKMFILLMFIIKLRIFFFIHYLFVFFNLEFGGVLSFVISAFLVCNALKFCLFFIGILLIWVAVYYLTSSKYARFLLNQLK